MKCEYGTSILLAALTLILGCGQSRQDNDMVEGKTGLEDAGKTKHRLNRLADEKSPYLLQHADNPVDWHAWGSEAFELAR